MSYRDKELEVAIDHAHRAIEEIDSN